MPLLSAEEFTESLRGITSDFATKFAEAAAKFPTLSEQRAAEQFMDNINTSIHKMQECIRPQDATLSLSDVLPCLQGFTQDLPENIFNLETFPLWQAYIERLLELMASQMKGNSQELLMALFSYISNEYARMCWLDLCVFSMHRTLPELSQQHHVPTEYELVKKYFVHCSHTSFICSSTNFCLFYFGVLLQEATDPRNRNSRGQFLPHLLAAPYTEILPNVVKYIWAVLARWEGPFQDSPLREALEYLRLSSFNPDLVQAFTHGSSIFLFSFHFFSTLLTLPQASAQELLDLVTPISKSERLALTPGLLLDWLDKLRTIDAQKTLILAIQELLWTNKLNFLLDLPNLPPNALYQFLRLLLLHREPARIVKDIVSALREDPNFLEFFDTFLTESGRIDLSNFADFVLQRYQQGPIDPKLSAEIKRLLQNLPKRLKNEEYDTYVARIRPLNEYLQALIKCQGNAVTIDYFLSLVTTEPQNLNLNILQRLTYIFNAGINNLNELIQLISDGSTETFQEKFENSNALDLLMTITSDSHIHLSFDTIKNIIACPNNCERLRRVFGYLYDFSHLLLTDFGIHHLHEIDIPFENILIFLDQPLGEKTLYMYVTALNVNTSTVTKDAQELVKSFFNSSEDVIEENTQRMALLLSFALGDRLRDQSPNELLTTVAYTYDVQRILYRYFEIYRKVFDDLSKAMSPEQRENVTDRLYTLFTRVIQQESRNAAFLMSEADTVADAVDTLKEAQAGTDRTDEEEPLPTLVLRAVVYEHSLLLFRRQTEQPQAPSVLLPDELQPENPTDPQKHMHFVQSFFSKFCPQNPAPQVAEEQSDASGSEAPLGTIFSPP